MGTSIWSGGFERGWGFDGLCRNRCGCLGRRRWRRYRRCQGGLPSDHLCNGLVDRISNPRLPDQTFLAALVVNPNSNRHRHYPGKAQNWNDCYFPAHTSKFGSNLAIMSNYDLPTISVWSTGAFVCANQRHTCGPDQLAIPLAAATWNLSGVPASACTRHPVGTPPCNLARLRRR